jgi:hypothetical protein
MFKKLTALMGLMRKGSEIADVEKWKARQVTGNMLGGFILAVVAMLKAFDVEMPVDEETALMLGGGIVAVFNSLLTVITSKRAGLPNKAKAAGDDDVAIGVEAGRVENHLF